MAVDVSRDFFSEASPAALRGVFATWTLLECKDWCAAAVHRVFICSAAHAILMFAGDGPAQSLNDDVNRLEHEIGLRLASEQATQKWFPASNDAREVGSALRGPCCEGAAV